MLGAMRSVTRNLALVIVLGLLATACGAGPTVTPSPVPGGQPTVVIESPVNGAPTPIGQPLTVDVRADDLAVGVNRIDLLVGGILVDIESTPGDVPQPMFAVGLQWTPTAEGSHTLTAIAYRPDGTASQPAEVTVAVVLAGLSLPPGLSPTPGVVETPSPTAPGPTPTVAARPTLPPFATPSPSPSPTPTPATPIDLAFTGDPTLPLTWFAGALYTLSIGVVNNGPGTAPADAEIRVRFCATTGPCGQGGGGTSQISPLGEGDALLYDVDVQPDLTGEQVLRIRLVLPNGYVDTNPTDNELTYPVTVQPPP
jgi:hypothetical protein